jgi:hypothetical protein
VSPATLLSPPPIDLQGFLPIPSDLSDLLLRYIYF